MNKEGVVDQKRSEGKARKVKIETKSSKRKRGEGGYHKQPTLAEFLFKKEDVKKRRTDLNWGRN